MNRIRFFKQHQVATLKKNIKENLSWYRGENGALTPGLDDYGEMSMSVDESCFDVLNKNSTEKDDKKNVIAIYNALNCLSLQQATEERIWTYATHVLAKTYVSKRWIIPEDDDKAVEYISTHYFVSGARGLIRDNAVSRLWWMGHVASRCKDYSLDKTLTYLLWDSDVRANLLERSSASASAEIFSGVIRILGNAYNNKSKKGIKESGDDLAEDKKPEIYRRKNFRIFMKALNQRGGRIMLNALKPAQLDAVLKDMVEKAIKNG